MRRYWNASKPSLGAKSHACLSTCAVPRARFQLLPLRRLQHFVLRRGDWSEWLGGKVPEVKIEGVLLSLITVSTCGNRLLQACGSSADVDATHQAARLLSPHCTCRQGPRLQEPDDNGSSNVRDRHDALQVGLGFGWVTPCTTESGFYVQLGHGFQLLADRALSHTRRRLALPRLLGDQKS